MEQPDTFLQSNLMALGVKCRPICVRSTMRRMLTAAVVRRWTPKIKEVNLSERRFGAGLSGGVEYVALRYRQSHQMGQLARLLAGILEKQASMLIWTESMVQTTCSVQRGLDVDLSEDACLRVGKAGL